MHVTFPNDRDMQLSGILDGEGKKGTVICSHFTGFKEIRHYYKLAKSLAGNGMVALRFDYSDCIGQSEGSCEDMKLTHQVRDTLAAMDFLESKGVERIGLMGHSLGGTTAIATAANDARVKALVSVAALARLEWDTLFRKKAEQWKKQGYITFPSWKRGEIKISYGFYKDLSKYDSTSLIRGVNAPVRVIHAGEDNLVSIENAKGIYENANEPKDLKIVEGADHMFSDSEHEDEMVNLCLKWFEKHL
ncbi:alpha/beta fold hydrolase [Candidatus Micrarchaeota archaeon]|nr:alpha/beta fold hydrolase [Candidatus Micrarchaeota archaeon]